jgi:hypothetical protein
VCELDFLPRGEGGAQDPVGPTEEILRGLPEQRVFRLNVAEEAELGEEAVEIKDAIGCGAAAMIGKDKDRRVRGNAISWRY